MIEETGSLAVIDVILETIGGTAGLDVGLGGSVIWLVVGGVVLALGSGGDFVGGAIYPGVKFGFVL
jgi:hypothetical protein